MTKIIAAFDHLHGHLLAMMLDRPKAFSQSGTDYLLCHLDEELRPRLWAQQGKFASPFDYELGLLQETVACMFFCFPLTHEPGTNAKTPMLAQLGKQLDNLSARLRTMDQAKTGDSLPAVRNTMWRTTSIKRTGEQLGMMKNERSDDPDPDFM